jgi:hypothetical protein
LKLIGHHQQKTNMKNFDSFYTELISDQRWFELLRMYRAETIRKAAQNVFAQLVADNTVDVRPMPENRKHVYNICIKGGSGDKPLPKPFQVVQAEAKQKEEEKEWIPLTGEQRAQKLKEWEAIVKGSTMLNSMPKHSYKTLAEEGGVLPPKPAPYPITTPEEAYVRDRHFEWIKTCFEPRTGEKNLNYVSEEDYNIWYDCEYLTNKGK